MKKIIIALASAAFMTTVQAATVNWGGAIAYGDADTEMNAGSKAWLLWSSTAFTGAATQLDTSTGTANNGGSIVSTYSITASDIANYAFTSNYTVDGAGVDGFYAILVADGSDLTKASYMDMGSISGTTATSPTSTLLYNVEWDDASAYLSSGGFNTTVGAVPEPTSGLLILLGMAGLALKRKRA